MFKSQGYKNKHKKSKVNALDRIAFSVNTCVAAIENLYCPFLKACISELIICLFFCDRLRSSSHNGDSFCLSSSSTSLKEPLLDQLFLENQHLGRGGGQSRDSSFPTRECTRVRGTACQLFIKTKSFIDVKLNPRSDPNTPVLYDSKQYVCRVCVHSRTDGRLAYVFACFRQICASERART